MMTLLKNILAIFGVLTIAFSAASDLQNIIALSKQVAFVLDNWSELVRAIWQEICQRLGLPYIEWLASPFSFLVASLALAVSAAVSRARERDSFFDKLTSTLTEEVAQAAPSADRAAARISVALANHTRLSLFDGCGTRVVPADDALETSQWAWMACTFVITGIYAASAVPEFAGMLWVETIFFAIFYWSFLYVIPFAFCARAAGRVGRLSWPTERERRNIDAQRLFRRENPRLAEALAEYRVMLSFQSEVTPEQGQSEVTPGEGEPIFEALRETVPASFLERQVYDLMAQRLLASALVVLTIYMLSYTIIILETVGILQ